MSEARYRLTIHRFDGEDWRIHDEYAARRLTATEMQIEFRSLLRLLKPGERITLTVGTDGPCVAQPWPGAELIPDPKPVG